MPGRKWIAIAEALLNASNLSSPACALALASSLDLGLLPSRVSKHVRLIGQEIIYPERMAPARLNREILGAIAEYALRKDGLPVHDISKRTIVMRLARSRHAAPGGSGRRETQGG
jgi:hypothetical protein